ncbi:pyridoxamine 5'-phosphate oxidase family protein [Actinomadura sp. 7K507]|uniref:pyridoxamine 5'-phosphate oxidase family protein n=1 Tax=Actinomadura sp. 7K507 TaxID=2530365 RepID=UPI00104E3B57|nr:pyridoxamine 5'-phosphate oxidase family protein [Actinomadura sp. 7K507]TDC86765.1 pyridoxamine 5'-phosphate oxidase family protein [Actinomadura sp. 7K507]
MEEIGVGAKSLTRAECHELMGTAPIGRIVFTEQALPAVLPVGFVLDGEDVVVCTPSGSTLVTAVRGAIVAFETDGFETGGATVWSVTVVGRARVVRDPGERVRTALRPWTAAADTRFVRISCERLTGRRIHRAAGAEQTAA